MQLPPDLPDERERLEDLRRLQILQTDPEPEFDRIVRLAAELGHSPIALISLVDDHRQWFKARVGLDASETPKEISFCGHAIGRNEPFVVLDALRDAGNGCAQRSFLRRRASETTRRLRLWYFMYY